MGEIGTNSTSLWPGNHDTTRIWSNPPGTPPSTSYTIDAASLNSYGFHIDRIRAVLGQDPSLGYQTVQALLEAIVNVVSPGQVELIFYLATANLQITDAIASGGTTGSGYITLNVGGPAGGTTRYIRLNATP